MNVLLIFLLATSAGSLSTLFWIPEDDMGRGYFQMNSLVVLGLLGISGAIVFFDPSLRAASTSSGTGSALLVALLGAFAYYAAVWREKWGIGRWAVALSLVGTTWALVAAGILLTTHASTTPIPYRAGLLGIGLLSSALILGWSLITMLLGHWYLVAPKLTFRHLVVFCWVLLAVVLLRIAAVGASSILALNNSGAIYPSDWQVLTGFAGHGIFFWFRLLWGLAIPLALSLMSLHCARRGANQSATGILYVLVVGTFIGEITSYYLTFATGIPV
jgi:hypothetical protein